MVWRRILDLITTPDCLLDRLDCGVEETVLSYPPYSFLLGLDRACRRTSLYSICSKLKDYK